VSFFDPFFFLSKKKRKKLHKNIKINKQNIQRNNTQRKKESKKRKKEKKEQSWEKCATIRPTKKPPAGRVGRFQWRGQSEG
jgi:hypothetical protein